MTSPLLQQVIDGTPLDMCDPHDDYVAVRRKFAPLHGHPLQEGTTTRRVTVGGVACVWVERTDGSDGTVPLDVLFCHGGAFVSCTADDYAFYAEIVAMQLGARVLVVDYRLAPEHPYPAALDDCVAAYRGLLEHGADAGRLVVMGDSCGGGIALATLYRARDAGLPMPAAMIALSGWLDLDCSGYAPEYAGRRDPFQGVEWFHRRARDYLGDDGDAHDPLASPARGDATGLPPVLLQVGEVDLHRQDAERFAQSSSSHHADVTVDVADGAVHGFHGLVGLGVDEAVQAWARAAVFVDRCTSTRGR